MGRKRQRERPKCGPKASGKINQYTGKREAVAEDLGNKKKMPFHMSGDGPSLKSMLEFQLAYLQIHSQSADDK